MINDMSVQVDTASENRKLIDVDDLPIQEKKKTFGEEIIIKGEPIPTKPRRSERLRKHYESDEFQRKRKEWHKPGAEIKIKGYKEPHRSKPRHEPSNSFGSIFREAKLIKIANGSKDKDYEEAKAILRDPAKWERWRWEHGRMTPTTIDKILQEPENILTYKDRGERIQAILSYLLAHGKTHYRKVSEDLGIPEATLYKDTPIAEQKGLFVNINGILNPLNPTPVDYDIFGFHNMGFTFDKQIPYGVYADSIKTLNDKPIIKDFAGRGVNEKHGNPQAEYKSYLPIESSDCYFQYSETPQLWQGIRESFGTNRFKLTDFELNIDIPIPGTKIKMWGVKYSRRDLEGFVRAYRKNMTTFRVIDLPVDLSDIGGFRKPEELLPLMDSVLNGVTAWNENVRLRAVINEVTAKYRKACKEIESHKRERKNGLIKPWW